MDLRSTNAAYNFFAEGVISNVRERYIQKKVDQLNQLKKHDRSEFPSKIRAIIDETFSDSDLLEQYPDRVLSFFGYNVKEFFMGRIKDGRVDLSDSLNSQIDTEQEVETLFRFLPQEMFDGAVLQPNTFFYRHPLYMMSSEPQAHSFIPVFVKSMKPHVTHILRYRSSVRNLLMDARNNLEDERSDAMIALRYLLDTPWFSEEKFLKAEVMFDTMHSVIKASGNNASFILDRTRFLIHWRPSLLKDCSLKSHRRTLVALVSHHTPNLWKNFDKDVLLELYGLVVELGLYYYPKELGFVFHGNVYQNACSNWGDERVATIVSDKILKILRLQSKEPLSLMEMVSEAATNEEISLDALYTLLHIDPIAITKRAITTSK